MANETSKKLNMEEIRLILLCLIRKTSKAYCTVRPKEDESNVLSSSLERDTSYPSAQSFSRYNGDLLVLFSMRGLHLLCISFCSKPHSEGK